MKARHETSRDGLPVTFRAVTLMSRSAESSWRERHWCRLTFFRNEDNLPVTEDAYRFSAYNRWRCFPFVEYRGLAVKWHQQTRWCRRVELSAWWALQQVTDSWSISADYFAVLDDVMVVYEE